MGVVAAVVLVGALAVSILVYFKFIKKGAATAEPKDEIQVTVQNKA